MMKDLPIPVGNCHIKRSCFKDAAVIAQIAIACYKLVGLILETAKECWIKILLDCKHANHFLQTLLFKVT
jgi:hypothetical protein